MVISTRSKSLSPCSHQPQTYSGIQVAAMLKCKDSSAITALLIQARWKSSSWIWL